MSHPLDAKRLENVKFIEDQLMRAIENNPDSAERVAFFLGDTVRKVQDGVTREMVAEFAEALVQSGNFTRVVFLAYYGLHQLVTEQARQEAARSN